MIIFVVSWPGVLRKTMPAHGVTANVLNYSAASVICAVSKDWGEVFGVFEEMARKGKAKKVLPNAACLTDLVVVSAKTGQWEELLEVRACSAALDCCCC